MGKITAFLCAIVTVLTLTGCQREDMFYRQVKQYGDNYCENGSAHVTLSQITDFAWDEALIFAYPTSAQEIEDAIGVQYDKSLDLVSGIIFVKDNQIVYDEIFYQDAESMPRLSVYTNQDLERGQHVRVVGRDTGFTCTKTETGGSASYTLVPEG